MTSLLLAATAISVVIAFILSTIDTKRRFGGDYIDVMLVCWGQIGMVLVPIILYSIVPFIDGGWRKVFFSPEVGMAATLVFLLAAQELSCAVALKANFLVNRKRVALLAQITLLMLCVSVATVVLLFKGGTVDEWALAWQVFLFFLSVLLFFCTAGVVRLIEVGHVPSKRA